MQDSEHMNQVKEGATDEFQHRIVKSIVITKNCNTRRRSLFPNPGEEKKRGAEREAREAHGTKPRQAAWQESYSQKPLKGNRSYK